MMLVKQATPADLDQLAPLFDAYRQFYGQPSDLPGARTFLAERVERQESVIFLALADSGEALGFTQLYPSFTSTRMKRIFILNDLYVAPAGRCKGIGKLLLQAAAEHACATGAARLTLSTAIDNHTAQSLYQANGWVRDAHFFAYNLSLDWASAGAGPHLIGPRARRSLYPSHACPQKARPREAGGHALPSADPRFHRGVRYACRQARDRQGVRAQGQ
jgi:ribosomal protein S18 acetylase RimI-like enzyme